MRPLEEELFKDGFAFVARHFPRTNVHDRAILTYLYARRRIGVAVKGHHYRLRESLPPEAEEALTPFRNFVRFVEAKRDGVKYSPDQPRVPEGNPMAGNGRRRADHQRVVISPRTGRCSHGLYPQAPRPTRRCQSGRLDSPKKKGQ